MRTVPAFVSVRPKRCPLGITPSDLGECDYETLDVNRNL